MINWSNVISIHYNGEHDEFYAIATGDHFEKLRLTIESEDADLAVLWCIKQAIKYREMEESIRHMFDMENKPND
jgi:hypothetical protein